MNDITNAKMIAISNTVKRIQEMTKADPMVQCVAVAIAVSMQDEEKRQLCLAFGKLLEKLDVVIAITNLSIKLSRDLHQYQRYDAEIVKGLEKNLKEISKIGLPECFDVRLAEIRCYLNSQDFLGLAQALKNHLLDPCIEARKAIQEQSVRII